MATVPCELPPDTTAKREVICNRQLAYGPPNLNLSNFLPRSSYIVGSIKLRFDEES